MAWGCMQPADDKSFLLSHGHTSNNVGELRTAFGLCVRREPLDSASVVSDRSIGL